VSLERQGRLDPWLAKAFHALTLRIGRETTTKNKLVSFMTEPFEKGKKKTGNLMKNEIQNDQNKQALMKVSFASLWRLTGSFFFFK
jgi:hypothetical protein